MKYYQLPKWWHLSIEIELRTYSSEQDKWTEKINKRLNAGFEGLTPKVQHKYESWLTTGQTRQLIFDMKTEKAVSRNGRITSARLKHSCVGVSIRIQPGDASSVQVLIQIGKEEWREIRCYYARKDDIPEFADITPDQFPDAFAGEHETENDSIESMEAEDIEEMEHADMMSHKHGSDSEASGSEFIELDIDEMIKVYKDAKEDPGKLGSGDHFRGNFLCMFILHLYLRYTHKHKFVDMNTYIDYAHLCAGGFILKDGKLQFIGMKKSAGEWVRSTLDIELPKRKGCKIQQHHPPSGESAWQLWYPKLNADDKSEAASRHRTGPTALKEVVVTPGNCNVIVFICKKQKGKNKR